MPNDNSAEVLSEASDNPPVNPPATTIMHNPHASGTNPLFSATQSPSVSLPVVPSYKIISGKFIDFTLVLSRVMLLGTYVLL